MENENNKKTKVPIILTAPRHTKIAIGEYSYSDDPEIKTIIVKPKNKAKGKATIKKSLTNSEYSDREDYYKFALINFIAHLMENDLIEKALELINIYFGQLTMLEKQLLSLNIIEATKQYSIPSKMLPETYYDFMASSDSDCLF